MLLRLLVRRLTVNSRNYVTTPVLHEGYKSSISLDKLYPSSSLDITKPPTIPQNGPKKFSGYIPMDKLKFTYSRSSGPGGQNVNCVSTKVEVRFKVKESEWIPEEIRNIMLTKYRSQISKEGYFVLTSDRTRYRHLNIADALEKIREFIRAAEPQEEVKPSEETFEKLRRIKEKTARERLRGKKERHMIKDSRGAASSMD